MFAEPFDVKMEKIVWKAAKSLEGGSKLHTVETSGGKDVTLICMEGPCFSTRAESHLYRSFGGSVINMYPLGRIGLMIGPPFQRRSSLVKLRSRIK
jgi:5'-methylthioadenosine phosphorylase